jgi:transcriptional regulator GlxA family with amidase domain
MSPHRVVALCLPWTVPFDLTAPLQAFLLTFDAEGRPRYELTTCSVDGAAMDTVSGFAIVPQGGLEATREADTIIVPGYTAILEPPPREALEALEAAAERGARVLSVCTGAFALAHAGLLDGRRATTHWAWAPELESRFPAVKVDAAALFVDEGRVLTSAGLSAGIDLTLHVIRKDFGAACGENVARHMVAPPHRDGGQAQYFKPPATGSAGGSLEPTRRWACDHLDQPLEVETLARHAGVSPRTFARRFREETGTTPLQWLLGRRVLEARRLLEETDLRVEEVAWRVGFGTAASLREHFRRATATTPTGYRRSFRPRPDPGAAGPGAAPAALPR